MNFLRLKTNSDRCVECQAALQSTIKIPDKYFQRKLNNLRVNCIACTSWTGTLAEYKEHYNQNHFTDSSRVCEFCTQEFESKASYTTHLQNYCASSPIRCAFESVGCSSNANCSQNGYFFKLIIWLSSLCKVSKKWKLGSFHFWGKILPFWQQKVWVLSKILAIYLLACAVWKKTTSNRIE
jgi:hypothetical protein